MKTMSFLAFLTKAQVASIPSKKVHRLIEYEEKKGAKLYWVICNKKGTVCIDQKESCDLFRLMQEHNETLSSYDNSQANDERIHGGAGDGKPRDAYTPLDDASC